MRKICILAILMPNFSAFANESEAKKDNKKKDKVEGSCSVTVQFVGKNGVIQNVTYTTSSSSAGGCNTWADSIMDSIEAKGYKINSGSSNYQSDKVLLPSK